MTDDPTYAGSRDPTRVNMHDPAEAAWRCASWRCTFAQLKAAIVAVNCVTPDQVQVEA